MLYTRMIAAAACGVLFLAGSALADGQDDHERAREAVAAGRFLPLDTIVARARTEVDGDILDVELEDEDDGRFVYEIKMLAPGAAS